MENKKQRSKIKEHKTKNKKQKTKNKKKMGVKNIKKK